MAAHLRRFALRGRSGTMTPERPLDAEYGQVRGGSENELQSGFRVVRPEALGLTFRCPVSDPRAGSLECRVLAYEESARLRQKHGKAV
jgi:hypothetical protein